MPRDEDYHGPWYWHDDRSPETGGRVPRWQWAVALLVGLGGAVLYCSTASCSSPTGLDSVATEVETEYGSVRVIGDLPAAEVRDGVERGYDDVARQGYHLRADGLTVAWSDATDRHGAYHPRLDLIELVDVEGLRHEIGHRACHQLRRPAWCCPRVGHGVDLRCRRG
jgi:hypothetical protein